MKRWIWVAVVALLVLLQPMALWAETGQATPAPAQADRAMAAGSYEVAPVRILGVPALVVASPQLHGSGKVVEARRRAELIEGNLRLLYQPQSLCTAAERLSEDVLEGLVLRGPARQRLCRGDRWGVLGGMEEDLRVESEPVPGGAVLLQARLPGRSVAIPLLTVTSADAQLHGLSPSELAADWRQLLERRLHHARRVMQPEQRELRLGITLLVELILGTTTTLTLLQWRRSRRALRWHQRQEGFESDLPSGRPGRLQLVSRALLALVFLQLVIMLGLGVAVVPGRVPLALAVLLQPLTILLKAAVTVAVVWLLRLMLHLLLRQWLSSLAVPPDQRARREQRYRNLLQAGQRLIHLAGVIVLAVWVLTGLPRFEETPMGTWLAGGAVLGALALVFQGLLRDFVAGLVVLFDDHYAVGDFVEIDGVGGDVEDVGVLATVLRTVDQRVVVVSNSRCELLVNHTKLRSGVELCLPLDPASPRLDEVMLLARQECEGLAADPLWKDQLQALPLVRGVRRVTPLAVELSILVLTRAGQQWAVERELLGRLVRRLQQEGVALSVARLAPPVS